MKSLAYVVSSAWTKAGESSVTDNSSNKRKAVVLLKIIDKLQRFKKTPPNKIKEPHDSFTVKL